MHITEDGLGWFCIWTFQIILLFVFFFPGLHHWQTSTKSLILPFSLTASMKARTQCFIADELIEQNQSSLVHGPFSTFFNTTCLRSCTHPKLTVSCVWDVHGLLLLVPWMWTAKSGTSKSSIVHKKNNNVLQPSTSVLFWGLHMSVYSSQLDWEVSSRTSEGVRS